MSYFKSNSKAGNYMQLSLRIKTQKNLYYFMNERLAGAVWGLNLASKNVKSHHKKAADAPQI